LARRSRHRGLSGDRGDCYKLRRPDRGLYNPVLPQLRDGAPRDYFPGLTGLRGIAACWVMLFHLWALAAGPRVILLGLDLTPIFSCGFLGVDLFFVLSGFLLGLPFLAWANRTRPFPNLVQFWKRRCLRVLPAYYIQLGLLIVAGFVVSGAWPVDLHQLLAYLSMEFVFVDGIGPMLNGVWWTLPIEWNYYLVLPLLGLAFARARWWLVALGVFVAVLGFRVLCYQLLLANRTIGPVAYPMIIQLPGRLDEFVFGMLAAWFHLRRRAPAPRRDHALLALGIACVIALLLGLDGRGDIFATADTRWIFTYATCAGASLALIVYAAAARAWLADRLFAGRALAFLGTISYSLYLWHAIVFEVAARSGFAQWAPAASLGRLAVALVPIVLVVSWISFRLTEHPFLVTAPAAQRDAASA
jgi:peptidoglycan/LPS O-acetylase OafA/YrhL